MDIKVILGGAFRTPVETPDWETALLQKLGCDLHSPSKPRHREAAEPQSFNLIVPAGH